MEANKTINPSRSKLLTAIEHLDDAISDLLAHTASTTAWEQNPGPGESPSHTALITLSELQGLRDRIRRLCGGLIDDPVDSGAPLLRVVDCD